MRRFSSYGPVDRDQHYYVPRQPLIDQAITHLVGEEPEKGGHYITVWAPRQRGKSWILPIRPPSASLLAMPINAS